MKHPVTCYFYTQYDCMARCRFCRIWRMSADPLALNTRLSLLRELRDTGVRHIDFTGGEPLLCDDLPTLLVEARRLGFVTSLTTNCFLYPRRHLELRGLVDFLGFSLNGADRETHDAVYGVPCFERLLESIQLAKNAGEMLHLHATATRDNIADLPALAEFAQSHKVPLVVFPEFSYFGNPNLGDSFLPQLRDIGRRRGAFVNRASLRIVRMGGNNVRSRTCRGINGAIAITPDGGMAIPCFHRRQRVVPVVGRLAAVLADSEVQCIGVDLAGRMPFCAGCQNWCYLNPSLTTGHGLLSLLHTWSALERYRAMTAASGRSIPRGLSLLTRLARNRGGEAAYAR